MTWRERFAAYRDVFRLVWPLALSMANNAVMQFVDRVFLANESTMSLEAVLPASILAFLFVGFFQSIIVYSGTFVAQYHGAGIETGCRNSYKSALILSALFGAALVGLVPVGNAILDFVGHSAEILEREKTYCSIVLYGGFATCGMMAASGYFTGKGRTRLVFWVNLLGNGLNILLDYLFIFGFDSGISWLRMAPCGIAGAAWATVVAQIVQMVLLNAIAARETLCREKVPHEEKPSDGLWTLTAKILRYGVPSGLQSMLNILSFMIFVFLTGKVGDMAFAVSNAAFTVNYLLIAPIEGIAVGAGILVGQHQGAGDSHGAFASGNRALILAEIYIAVSTTLVLIFRREADMRAKIDSLLCDIGRKDQEVRADWAKVATGSVTQEEAIEYALKLEETDSTNLASVSRILDTYGWPSGLSDAANKAIFLVIDHSDLKTMNKYIGLFHDAVEKGYAELAEILKP